MKLSTLCLSLFFILLFFCSLPTYAQNSRKVDSLEKLIATTKLDSVKMKLHLSLFSHFLMSDSLKSRKNLNKCLQYLKKSGVKFKSDYYYRIGNEIDVKQNDYDLSAKFYDTAVNLAKAENNPGWVKYERWLGYTLSKTGDNEGALKHCLNAMQHIENKNLGKEMPLSNLLLAFVYRQTGDLSKSMHYFTRSIEWSNKMKDSSCIHTALHEIGNTYTISGNFAKAIEYHKKALKIREQRRDTAHLVFSYHDIGVEYLSMDSLALAMKYLTKASEIAEKQNELWMSFNANSNICTILISLRKFDEAKLKLKKIQEIADALKMKSMFYTLYNNYYNFYKTSQNYEEALKYYELSVLYKDSISNEEVRKNINELDKKFDTAKKDKELIKNHERIKQQRIIINSIIISLLLVSFFMILVTRQYRQKRKAFQQLEIQNNEILLQKEEIQAQAENLEKANNEIMLQKDIIEKSHEQITASITYAQRIQEAVLPGPESLVRFFPGHFILFMPRDRVSGDFYFFKPHHNYVFLGVADCTGHGVPGAFMSMLGVAFLNELVRRPDIQSAAGLLDELRAQIKSSLQQTGKYGEQQDGMDIAFAIIDLNTNTLNFAGAHNAMFIIRNGEIIELKADRMPVGIYPNEHPFTNQIFKLQKNDRLYLFTDGYYSQFHHTTKLPMKIKLFKETLYSIHSLGFDEQKSKLETFFHQWKGAENQVDDVLVMGLMV